MIDSPTLNTRQFVDSDVDIKQSPLRNAQNHIEEESRKNPLVMYRSFDARNLFGANLFRELRERYPNLPPDVRTLCIRYPQGAFLAVNPHSAFQHEMDFIAQSVDRCGVLGAGSTGNHLAGHDNCRTTREEEASVMRQALEASGLEPDVHQLQVGGFPYNKTTFAWKDIQGIFRVLTADCLVGGCFSESPDANGITPFFGIATDEQGNMHPVLIDNLPRLDLQTYTDRLTAYMNEHRYITMVSSGPPLVLDGKALTEEQIYCCGFGFNDDPRHYYALPFLAGLENQSSYQQNVVSGSILHQELLARMRSGNATEIYQAAKNKTPVVFKRSEIGERTMSLLQRAVGDLKDQWAKKISTFGFDVANIQAFVDEKTDTLLYIPQFAVYNHVIWGLTEDNQLQIMTTSGLIGGKVSGQAGVTLFALAQMAEQAGFHVALFGSQGRDGFQIYKDGKLRTDLLRKFFGLTDDEITIIDAKLATSPSVFILSPKQQAA